MRRLLLVVGVVAATTASAFELPNVRLHVDFNLRDFSSKYTADAITLIRDNGLDLLSDHLNAYAGFLQYAASSQASYHLTFTLDRRNPDDPDRCSAIDLLGALTRTPPSAESQVIVVDRTPFRPWAQCGGAFGDPIAFLSELQSAVDNADSLWLSNLLRSVELLGPFEHPEQEANQMVRLRQPDREILVAITKWRLGMSTASTFAFGFQMHVPDGVIVDWQRYPSGAIAIFAPGADHPFDNGLLSSLEFPHPSTERRFIREDTKISDLAVYMQSYIPEDPLADALALQIGERNFHEVLRLANIALVDGQPRIANLGFSAVVRNSLDAKLVDEATSSWLQLRADSGYLSRSALQHLPIPQASGVVTRSDILRFLDDPDDVDSPVWKSELLQPAAPNLLLTSCAEAAGGQAIEDAVPCYEGLLYGDFPQSRHARMEAAIGLLRIRSMASDWTSWELDQMEDYLYLQGLLGDDQERSRLDNALRIADTISRTDQATFDEWTSADWDLWLQVDGDGAGVNHRWATDDFDAWLEAGREDPTTFDGWESDDWGRWPQLRNIDTTAGNGERYPLESILEVFDYEEYLRALLGDGSGDVWSRETDVPDWRQDDPLGIPEELRYEAQLPNSFGAPESMDFGSMQDLGMRLDGEGWSLPRQ